jgi:hypothetical protein
VITTTMPAAGVLMISIDGHRRRNALDLDALRALAVTSGLATDLAGAYAIEDRISREILLGPEAAEGSRAFAQKRPPSWRLT